MNSKANKRIAKNTVMLYFRMLLSMIVTLYTSRVVLNTLGVEDFGIYSIVAGVIIMFGFLNSAMAASTQRFLTFEIGKGDQINLQKIFNASLTIHILIAVIVLLLAETVGLWFLNSYLRIPLGRMEAANWVYQFSVLLFIFNIINVPYNASIIANERMGVFAFLGIVEVILKLIVVFLLVLFEYDKLIIYSFLLLIVAMIIRSIDSFYCSRNFEECKNVKLIWDKDLLIDMGEFAGWNLFGVAAGVGYNQGVNVILNIFFGATINATRGIAFQVQGAISNLVTNFQMASTPMITKHYAKKDYSETFNLVFRTSKFSFFLLLFIAIPLLIQTKTILILWLKIIPDYTVIFTQLIIIDLLVNSLSGPLHSLIQATGKVKKYQLFVSGLLLLNLPTSYLFLKLGYSPEVTVVISIFYSFIALFLRLNVLRIDVNFPMKKYFNSVLLKVVIVGIGSYLIPYFSNYYLVSGLFNVFLIFTVSTIFTIICVLAFGLDEVERGFVVGKFKMFLKRSSN